MPANPLPPSSSGAPEVIVPSDEEIVAKRRKAVGREITQEEYNEIRAEDERKSNAFSAKLRAESEASGAPATAPFHLNTRGCENPPSAELLDAVQEAANLIAKCGLPDCDYCGSHVASGAPPSTEPLCVCGHDKASHEVDEEVGHCALCCQSSSGEPLSNVSCIHEFAPVASPLPDFMSDKKLEQVHDALGDIAIEQERAAAAPLSGPAEDRFCGVLFEPHRPTETYACTLRMGHAGAHNASGMWTWSTEATVPPVALPSEPLHPFDYPAAARSLHLNLREFCDESLPYPRMIAEAGRQAAKEVESLRSRLTEAETQRDAFCWVLLKRGTTEVNGIDLRALTSAKETG